MIAKLYQMIPVLMIFTIIQAGGISSALAAGNTLPAAAQAAGDAQPFGTDVEPVTGNVHEMVSGLSDEQVRRLLVEELQKTEPVGEDRSSGLFSKGFFSAMLERLESLSSIFYWRVTALQTNYVKLPHDMSEAIDYLADGKGLVRFSGMIASVLIILLVAHGIEKLIRRISSLKKRFASLVSPVEGLLKLWGALLKALPDILGILIFAVTSFTIYMLVYGPEYTGIRPLFLASLAAILAARLVTAISAMMLSPSIGALRLIPFDDATAKYVHRYIVGFAWVIILFYALVLLFKYAGMWGDSLILLIIACVAIVILLAIVMVLRQQSSVALKLRGCTDEDCAGSSWLMDLFASVWHLLAIGYLIAVFLLGSARLIIYGPQLEIPFIISLLIVPIYLTLDSAANWVINALIGTVRSQDGGEDISSASKLALTGTAQETSMRRTMRRIFRAAIVFTLIIWLLNIWGFEVPFAKPLAEAAFEIFITLVLSYMIWRMINGFISRKLAEAQPEADQKEEEDEWGGAATQDRSYTLLPIVRKFIATVMVVMVTLIVLSSLGVNIGPLLAGAGVAGLAIGFGAQKLVADVLSGIFYLVDDAFRVGEYIQAGSVSGAVEAITLRNVMLRHHRGMLQIVPFSDLGPVTNFMRGGIVVKFNLQFPYDTDINKVRKIIKKVGKKMLEDPEFGSNFIKPVKSQGVREVGDSVMTIRVKFTAKPGTHFVIRREAYRRITEALEAKGIHYAHRRVIVEVAQPEADQSGENTKQGDNPTADASRTPIDDPKVSRAAAAAAERMVRNHRIKPDSDF